MYECRRSQATERSEGVPVVKVVAVITDPSEVNKIPLMPEKEQFPAVR